MAGSNGQPGRTQGGYRPIGKVSAAGEPSIAGDGSRVWRFVGDGDAGVEVALLAQDLARVRLEPPGIGAAPSWAVVERVWPTPEVHVDAGERGMLTLTTDAMRLELAIEPFRLTWSWPDGATFAEDDADLGMGWVPPVGPTDIPDLLLTPGSVRCFKPLAPGERILGAGERTSALDRRGQALVFYNVDPPQPHGPDTRAMYVAIPFWLGLREGRAYGIFLDSVYRADLDAGATRPDRLSFGAAGGELTYYVLAGPDPAAVLARFADLTGHMPLPPRWALGYHQSRWSYYPEEQVRQVADEFRRRRIPCDALWLDIDYMDGYRVFTWNPWRFAEPERLLRDLDRQGFRVVTIVDPGVKADPTDPTYREGLQHDYFVRRPDGSLYSGVIWPGEAAFPDFSRESVRQWWGERHRPLLDAGVSAIWDDMNEPSLTDRFVPGAGVPHGSTMPPDVLHLPEGPSAPATPHAAFHNAYGLQMARATYDGLARLRPNRRPFVLSRAGYAGIQRYAAIWTGDNLSAWDHLRLAMRMCLGLGLSGVPFVGFDTGGFWRDATGELLVRFTQLGVLFPFFRNHSAHNTHQQEPWAFGQPFEAHCRAAIELRYRLLPYLYTLFERTTRDGAPISRPLVYAFPQEVTYAEIEDEVLVGTDLLAAPVLQEDQVARAVHFPPGAWRELPTGERFVGPLRALVATPLDLLPLYAREGAVIPLGPVQQYTGERPPDPLTLAVYLSPDDGAAATGELYEDDGETPAYQAGLWRRTRFHGERTESVLRLHAEEESGGIYAVEPRDWLVEFHLPHLDPAAPRPEVELAQLLDKPELSVADVVARRHETLVRVPLGRVAPPWTLEVRMGGLG
jgi:alpha-glucosidase